MPPANSLRDKLKNIKPPKKRTTPVWACLGSTDANGGITYSLLSRFLCCRERFRLLVVEGLKPRETFNSRMEFGNMWHICEEALASEVRQFGEHVGTTLQEDRLREFVQVLCKKYPLQREDIAHWAEKCAVLFPVYIDYWAKHPQVKARTPLLQEYVFSVPYKLPSGRTVDLRGKWDAVDLIGKGKDAGIWIQENKTKSQIDGVKIARQLTFDLQSMLYFVTLNEETFDHTIRGVRYNVIRRSAHKTIDSMMKKVNEDLANRRDGEWFARFEVPITASDVEKFKRQCLDPVLENCCDDYEWWSACKITHQDVWDYETRSIIYGDHQNRHFRMPFGVYDPIKEGGSSDLDAYLESGSEAGLQRTEELFTELKGG